MLERIAPLAVTVAFALSCAGPSQKPTVEPNNTVKPPTVEDARKFLDEAEARLAEKWDLVDRADFVYSTHITHDTERMNTILSAEMLELYRELASRGAKFRKLPLSERDARRLQALLLDAVGIPTNAGQKEYARLTTKMGTAFSTGRACLADGKCLTLDKAGDVLRTGTYDEKLAAWTQWHEVGAPIAADYERFVALSNKGARHLGYADTGARWRANYGFAPKKFEAEIRRLSAEVRPLYSQLHCLVRRKLSNKYGADKVALDKPIPAHLFGNMWAQDWAALYPLVEPHPNARPPDITAVMKAAKWDAKRMVEAAEAFFVSLGFEKLPKSFWKRSMLTRPRDRAVACHPTAYTIAASRDVRIKMCTRVNARALATLHHELGHIYYYLANHHQPWLLRAGANPGFREGIGDTLKLSMTPSYLRKLGLITNVKSGPKVDLNLQMKEALTQLPVTAWAGVVDLWRWRVFDGTVGRAQYNAEWWRLRKHFQGIAPPAPRKPHHFDPGAKYHIPANTPYARYFVASILMFQFYKGLCTAAGHTGALHTCSIFGSKAAGKRLGAMLRMGRSRPWAEALEAVTGETKMSATALLEYFAPLAKYLKQQNRGHKCGW